MKESEDGFRIAEEDLKIRGGGDILGTKQSGLQNFIFFNFLEHGHLLEEVQQDVEDIITSDPKLTSERGRNLKELLYIFEHDQQVDLINAG
jgi:ATP-dependent DNA helicase RecG